MFETPIDPAVTLSPATLNLSSNNSTLFFLLQWVGDWRPAPLYCTSIFSYAAPPDHCMPATPCTPMPHQPRQSPCQRHQSHFPDSQRERGFCWIQTVKAPYSGIYGVRIGDFWNCIVLVYELFDPWRCHGEVSNPSPKGWIQRWDIRPYGRIVPSLNLYPSFMFNV